MSEEIAVKKSALRKEIQAMAAGFPEAERSLSDQAITRQLLFRPEVEQAKTIFCYVSVAHEVDTRHFIQEMLSKGKRICVPLCLPQRRMEAREISSLATLQKGPFGLLEPTEEHPLVPREEIDLVIAPCLAADTRGHRLGHGAGYYDRYLKDLSCPTLCLCRSSMLLWTLPVQPFDVPAAAVLTENGSYP